MPVAARAVAGVVMRPIMAAAAAVPSLSVTLPAPLVRTVGLSRTAAGDVVPSAAARARMRARDNDPVLAWVGTVAVTLLAAFLRLWDLGKPRAFLFDETYYAKDAWSLLHFGYAQDYVDKANAEILAGHTDGLWTGVPNMVVHPEVGKWLIALGEHTFGMTPFGWRISSAIVGSLMVMVMIRLARRVTRSTLLGLTAGLLMCFDGLQLVLSRLALLDIFVAFFTLCAVSCLVADRDWGRARLARSVPPGARLAPHAWGPLLLWRPWRLAAGVSWGLAIGTKWSALLPARGVRDPDVALGQRRPPVVRRTTCGAEVGRRRRPTGPGATSWCCRC